MVFDRFTEKAKAVMAFARQEVQRLQTEYIGTEHLLLGLLKQDFCLGIQVLKDMKIDIEKLRAETKARCKTGSTVIMGQIPFTPRSKRVIESALEEANSMGDNHIGTEHLLLGMVREDDAIAGQVLHDFGIEIERARNATSMLRRGSSSEPAKDIISALEKDMSTFPPEELLEKTICFSYSTYDGAQKQIEITATVLAVAKYPDGGMTLRIANPIPGEYDYLEIRKGSDQITVWNASGGSPGEGKLISIS